MTQMVPATHTPSAALALAEQRTQRADLFQPQTVGDCLELATILSKGRLMPKGLETPEAIFTVVMTGLELGLSAMQSVRSIYVWNGRPTIAAELMVALVKNSAACKFFQLVTSTDTEATYRTQRTGEPEPTTMTYTIAQAQRANLTGKDTWKHHPAAMLRARAQASLCRAVYPDVTLGIYADEEAEDTVATEAPKQLPAADLQARITATAPVNDGVPVEVSEEEVRRAIGAGRDLDAMKATTKDLGARYPGQQKMIRAVFDALKKERAAAAAAKEAAKASPEAPKSTPKPAPDEADPEPPADVKLDGELPEAERGDAYEGP